MQDTLHDISYEMINSCWLDQNLCNSQASKNLPLGVINFGQALILCVPYKIGKPSLFALWKLAYIPKFNYPFNLFTKLLTWSIWGHFGGILGVPVRGSWGGSRIVMSLTSVYFQNLKKLTIMNFSCWNLFNYKFSTF